MARDRAEILAYSIEHREDEIFDYDLNIEMYEASIAKIDAEHTGGSDMDKALQEHRKRLAELLRTERIERAKSALMLASLKAARDNA